VFVLGGLEGTVIDAGSDIMCYYKHPVARMVENDLPTSYPAAVALDGGVVWEGALGS
jgi:hypothetical protein